MSYSIIQLWHPITFQKILWQKSWIDVGMILFYCLFSSLKSIYWFEVQHCFLDLFCNYSRCSKETNIVSYRVQRPEHLHRQNFAVFVQIYDHTFNNIRQHVSSLKHYSTAPCILPMFYDGIFLVLDFVSQLILVRWSFTKLKSGAFMAYAITTLTGFQNIFREKYTRLTKF